MIDVPRRPVRQPAPLPVLPHVIMGCDLSLTNSGVAIYRAGRITSYSLKSSLKGVARLDDLRLKLRQLIDRERPDIAGIEGYSFASKNSRAHSIGEWGGTAKLLIRDQGIPGYIASPNTVKKFMTGNHQAKKPEMVLHLFKRYGIEITQEDEADAASVSILIGAYQHGASFPNLTAFQFDAFKGLEPLI